MLLIYQNSKTPDKPPLGLRRQVSLIIQKRGTQFRRKKDLQSYALQVLNSPAGRNADHARTCTEYDILDEEYPTWKREVRTAGDRAEDTDQFYTVRDYESHRQILLNADGFYKHF